MSHFLISTRINNQRLVTIKYLIMLSFLVSFRSYAHPVAYARAYSYMAQNTSKASENTLVYSPKYWLGYGLKHIQSGENEWTNLHLGFLLKRWNEFEYQGNIYLFGGPGRVKYQGEEASFAKYGFQADWETRRVYTLFKYTSAQSDLIRTEEFVGRVGFAPFVAGFNDLNAWGILQVKYSALEEKQTEITPYLRMFYKNVLWEMGSSLDQNWMFNFMVRF